MCSTSLKMAWESVWSNAVPMFFLWCAATLLVVSYYFVPGVSAALEPIAEWQRQRDLMATSVNRLVFCGLLPGVVILVRNAGCVWRTIVAQTVFAVGCGVICNWMYTLNAHLFGTGIDLATVSVKTAVCQFVWTPVFFVPMGSVVYLWIGCGLSWRRLCAERPRPLFSACYLPNLIVNWIVWIPVAMVIHLFPTALQIQLSGLASAFLSIAFLVLGRKVRQS